MKQAALWTDANMEPLDFAGKTSNQILEELAAAAEWLAAQYESAKPHLDVSIADKAVTDLECQFAWQAGRQHLPTLVNATRRLIAPPDTPPVTLGFLDIGSVDE